MKSKNPGKDWLHQKYTVEKLSGRKIAKICDCHFATVYKWLRGFNIPMRGNKGKNHYNWKGGRNKHGKYTLILKPEHPRAFSNNGYVAEQIVVAEETLKRSLKFYGKNHPNNEVVHHIRWWEKSNNNPNNLYVCPTRASHTKTHKNLVILALKFLEKEFEKGNIFFDRQVGEYKESG